MKKISLLIPIIFLTLSSGRAQTVTDVVRYSTENLQGTARYQALSGAFGALGGDISAIHVNPAGSAVFSYSKSTLSATDFIYNNTTSYFDNEENTKDGDIKLNQIGGVFVFDMDRDAAFKKITLGLSYEQSNNLNNEFFARGTSNISVDNYFLSYANGVRLEDLQNLSAPTLGENYLNIGAELGYPYQQAFLGYWAGVIEPADPLNPANVNYISNGVYNTVTQDYLYVSEGHNSKFTLNLATQYKENFYFGASFNFHSLNYDNYREFSELDYDPASSLQVVYFDNLLSTRGNAVSFNVGGIARIHKRFRVGVSYQSPIWWFKLTDEFSQRINTNIPDGDLSTINFNLINVFPDYKLQVPSKLTGSFATIFGKHGLISFDYDYQDFSKSRLKPESDPYFELQNNLISTRLKSVSTFRIGGEYRTLSTKRLSIRAGYRLQDSAYTNGESVSDLTGYSFGLGYNFGGTQLDTSFNQYNRSQIHQLFDPGLPNTTAVDGKNTNVTLSLSIRL